MYDSLLLKRGFNGGIIVAKNGQVLLEDYRGYFNLVTKDTITPNTPFHVASVSKTFTGMAIMKLWEENRLKLDDSLQVFFPDFPYKGITVQMLLNHRSGLPNYAYLMPKEPHWKKNFATNHDMLRFLVEKKPQPYNKPDRGFQYCNTNYALLALVVEKVTGQPFPEYMKNNVFTPLGMQNTFVFSIKDTADYVPSFNWDNSPARIESMDCIYGDKNVYTTPRDLLLWDDALYSNKFVTEATLDEAIQPTSFEKPGSHNYGMGWRLVLMPNNKKIVYHNGWWHGNNSSFTRMIHDTVTIIIVGNKFNRAIYSGQKFGAIFNNQADDENMVE
ncbi:serine hydrolase domain-containing protein [Aridibaculum aurantiacum]|uniref:serine hydrolase domain-containing protein n=1 Tax=Aridibaculum aurantiacum TaxID=2810307 RepID=UPI001F600130|nr:serine hydrolase domain-containing protein [Aridibaculum aurantiacum]